ncbi:MAG TPA: glycosyl transferase family 2, partial [Blastocatellia bacterium]|nr:glycosyl transferase family 2 [Blastocatellia bacterium]
VAAFYGSSIAYVTKSRTERWKRYALIPVAMGVGIGLVFSNTRAVLEAVFGIKSSFVRTPKYAVKKTSDSWLQQARTYRRKQGFLPLLELLFALYFVAAIAYAIRSQIYGTIPFLMIFLIGYGYMGLMSLFQSPARMLLQKLRRE